MDEVLGLLVSATTSIKIQQQYIRVDQPLIKKLLASIPQGVEVQMIVAQPKGYPDKTIKELETLQSEYGFSVRMLSSEYFVHCHNKLIIVDNEKVLIGSHNWSDYAVSRNREAGVIVYDQDITAYYAKMFDADWTISDVAIEESVIRMLSIDLEACGTEPGKYIRLDACRIQEI